MKISTDTVSSSLAIQFFIGLLLIATLTFHVPIATGAVVCGPVVNGGSSPQGQREGRSLASQQETDAQRSLLRMLPKVEKARCRYQAEECNPYTARCCGGMRCSNYMGGFCVSSYEKCICYPASRPEDN